MTDQDVEILDRRTVWRGYFRIDAYRLRHRRFDGTWTPGIEREIFERGHAAAVLLYDPDRDVVVLTEQFRVGAMAAGWTPWLIETAAGILDPGERAEDCARREAREETGCTVTELMPIHTYLASPGGTSETVALFCGRVDSEGIGGLHGNAHEHEDIRVHVVPVAEAVRMLDSGGIKNAMTLIALHWLARHHDELRARWRRAAPA